MFDEDSKINVEETLSKESLQFIKKSGFWEIIGRLIDIFHIVTIVSALPILLVMSLLYYWREMNSFGQFIFIFLITGTVIFLMYMIWEINSDIKLIKFDDMNSKEFRNELELFLKESNTSTKEKWEIRYDNENLIRLHKNNWLEIAFLFKNDSVLGCMFSFSSVSFKAPFRGKKNKKKLIQFVDMIKKRIKEKNNG